MIKTILFDWDGTLHNTAKIYHKAVQKAYAYLVEAGYAAMREIKEEESSKYLGMTAKEMWASFMPDLPREVQQTAEKMIGDEMVAAVENGEAELYPGTIETLTRLRKLGYNMLVLSNCKEAYMKAHRDVFLLDRFFCEYACAESYDFIPKEEIFLSIQSRYEGDFLMIGDRRSDILVGKNKGVYTLGCLYGFGESEELVEATAVIEAVTEVEAAIKIIN